VPRAHQPETDAPKVATADAIRMSQPPAVPDDRRVAEAGIVTATVTSQLHRRDPGLRRVGRLMRTMGIIGVGAGLLAIAVTLWLLSDLDALLGRSLTLTSESLTTVDASLSVAAGSVTSVNDGLADAEQTSRGLEDSLDDGASLLRETARLTRYDIATSLESFERSLPALIQVSGTVDSTLRAVDELPVGPEYDPEEPFDETLQALQDDLDGLPEDLREQADTIDEAGDNLGRVGRQSVGIADSLTEVRTNLDEAGRVLNRYQTTAGRARDLLEQTQSDLDRRLWVLRALVIVLGVIYCFGQILPIYLGTRMAETFTEEDSVVEGELLNR
jgi:DNA-binding ferritin-like protein